MMRQASDDKSDILCSVFTELKGLGVKVPKIKKFKSSIPKQARPVSVVSSSSSKIFGVNINEQEKISFADYLLPKFIVTSTLYLKKFAKREIGLFRKAGSVSRQRALRAKLENGESIEDSEPNDVASLLKQWLRELPEPLVPCYLQNLFVRCQNLKSKENRINAVLLCCHLLPADHLHTLKHLLHFLSEVANYSEENKMGAHNLALIMAPNIFVMETDSIDKSSNNLVQQHTSIIELLINNVHRFDELPRCTSLHLAEAEALKFGTELDLSIDILDDSVTVPRPKKRSGGVQDIFTGIRKLVSQNSLSPNPKKSNQDDCKSTESRSASKRKADPETLLMSPFKKLATTDNVSQTEGLVSTPLNKSTQSIFGMRSKANSMHSQKTPFGLLKRKERKRQKSAKSSVSIETKLTIRTPYPFEEKLAESVKIPSPVQETCFIPHSPISPIDVEKLFSKCAFEKKSISDCHLTVPKEEIKCNCSLSTSSSDGCLHFKRSNHSPYYLRSDTKKALKRKSNPSVEITEKGENNKLSSWFNRRNSGPSPKSRRTSPQQQVLTPEDVNSLPNITVNLSEESVIFTSNPIDENDSLNLPQAPIQRSSSCVNSNSESMKRLPSASQIEKPEVGKSVVRGDVRDVNDNVPSIVSAECDAFSASSSLQNREAVRRKCSVNRQESLRSNSRKKTLSHLKRADSIKLSKSKSCRINNQNSDGKTIKKTVSNSTNEVSTGKKNENGGKKNENAGKKNENAGKTSENVGKTSENAGKRNENVGKKNENVGKTSENAGKKNENANVLEKKRTRKNVRNGSIVRGRPNTVKTGLPSDACNRYNNESFSVNNRHRILNSTSVDSNVRINVDKRSKDNSHDISITLQIKNITLSSPKEDKPAVNLDTENNVQNCTFKTTVSVTAAETTARDKIKANTAITIKETKADIEEVNSVKKDRETSNSTKVKRSASRKRVREKLSSNSDSKIDKNKRRPSNVSRINSFPGHNRKLRPRYAKKLRTVKSSSSQAFAVKEVTNSVEVENENVFVQESTSIQSNLNSPKPSETNAKSPETWVSGREFLEAQEAASNEAAFHKRESIAMILKNKPGHVRAKAHMYDYRSSSFNTPISVGSSTPRGKLYDPQYSDMQVRQSQKKSTSVKSSKSLRRNSPLLPPPKFVLPESPTPSYPLKELTNISNCSEDVFSPSPAIKRLGTPNKDISVEESRKKCTLKQRNSYSGRTPYKLPSDQIKVFRSESSPLLHKVAIARKSHESLVKKKDNGLSSSLKKNYCSSPMLNATSCLNLEK